MRFEEIDEDQFPPGEARIRVEAAGVNFFENLLVRGQYQVRPVFPFVPGAEASGTLLAPVPSLGLQVGDRVMAITDGRLGGFGEIAHAPASTTFVMPDEMSAIDGGGFLASHLTAYIALHHRATVVAGEVVLVHAGAGALGSAAIRIALAAGARVVATAGSAQKVQTCIDLGAEAAFNYSLDDFVDEIRSHTNGRGVDIVIDTIGGDAFERSTKVIGFGGRIVVIGFASGTIPTLRLNHLLLKNYSVVGMHINLYLEHEQELVRQAVNDLIELYRSSVVRPLIKQTFPLADAPVALDAVWSRQTIGKAVVVH